MQSGGGNGIQLDLSNYSDQRKKVKRLLISFMALLVLSGCSSDAVPDRATAIRIAKADWYKNTGKQMDQDYPLEAFSRGGIWVVTIRLPSDMLGGGPTVEINKKDGRILRRYMTQ